MQNDSALFFRLWLKAPLSIASMSPSGATLARAMARHIDVDPPDPVLELGGGTGSITAALLAAGLPPEKLLVIEKEPELCAVLRRRFPETRVLEGEAAELDRLVREVGVERLSAVVSSLPIIWLPLVLQRTIVDQAFDLMPPDGRFLQVTNQPNSPLPKERLGLSGRRVDTIWRNLPPSGVWQYGRARPNTAAAAQAHASGPGAGS